MKQINIAALGLITVGLMGCQSITSSSGEVQAQKTNHESQHVYELEFLAANNLMRKSQILNEQVSEFCSNSLSLQELQNQWMDTMQSWMALQGQERGPADALKQSWNIQFWPDKKNTTGRKMTQLLEQETVTLEDVEKGSVTIQGLSALEWLLFDNLSPLMNNKYASGCIVMPLISENLANNTENVTNAWKENPWRQLDHAGWLSEYVSLLSNQLEFSLSKLVRPMANIGKPRPYFAESWRSKMSLANMKSNVKAIRTLYIADGYGLDSLLRAKGYDDVADRTLSQLDNLISSWPESNDLFDSLQTKAGYRQALLLRNKLEQLKYLMHDEVSVALGVTVGFNATDGD
ncbi:imelysin family protein [Vibrio viridaestus]|uniref:Iron-regulated protein A n=1 Tax=Vibrio viridaestus TaxID=2487322 RepID=A0A3N9THW2_9VIBR|nr:imelysin family protein [Vibrio viridaestus]RQW63473.1 iron-regulated protein A [Vibrio viridaestus]